VERTERTKSADRCGGNRPALARGGHIRFLTGVSGLLQGLWLFRKIPFSNAHKKPPLNNFCDFGRGLFESFKSLPEMLSNWPLAA
jgi:hypothetical protein